MTHVVDAFALYQVAVVNKEPSANKTLALLRDTWFTTFGPPTILMSDQGSGFHGVLGDFLQTFAVFHDMTPPTAHWRMALAERHGAVLKLMIMKVV